MPCEGRRRNNIDRFKVPRNADRKVGKEFDRDEGQEEIMYTRMVFNGPFPLVQFVCNIYNLEASFRNPLSYHVLRKTIFLDHLQFRITASVSKGCRFRSILMDMTVATTT